MNVLKLSFFSWTNLIFTPTNSLAGIFNIFIAAIIKALQIVYLFHMFRVL